MRVIVALALLLASTMALADGAYVTKSIQNELGQQVPTLYYDMSGTGAGPFQPVTVSMNAGALAGAAASVSGALTNPVDVSCAAGAACQLSGATSRRYLSIVMTSTVGTCRIGYGVAPSATRGDPLAPAALAGGQGGSRTFEASFTPTGAVTAYCSSAATLAVLEAP